MKMHVPSDSICATHFEYMSLPHIIHVPFVSMPWSINARAIRIVAGSCGHVPVVGIDEVEQSKLKADNAATNYRFRPQ